MISVAKRIAKYANPLALLAAAQPYSDNYYQAPKPQRTNTTSSSTRPSASTRHKGKEIAKPVTPQSESVSEEDSDPEQAQRDKDMQKNLALLAKYFKRLYKPTNNNLRTSSNSKNKTEDTTPRYNNDNQSGQFGNQRTITVAGARETVGSQVVQQNGIQCFNCKGFGHYAKECRKPKRVKDYSYHKEKMMMCKQAEHGVPLQADWLADTDEEIDEQELEAHYSFMAKIQEVLPEESSSTEQPLEQVQNNDENNVFANERQHSENNTTECADERAALANLIANLTLDTEENKTILKQLKKANASLTQELEECKTNLDETSRALGEATSCRDSCLIALQTYRRAEEVVPKTIVQVKFNHKEVEEHHRISSISIKTKFVTACNDSSKSKTLNVNAVGAECGKCVFNSNHDACVSRYLNDVNARTKKPKVYYVKSLNHNLFSVGQFCDADLEVAFRKSTYFVRDLQGNNLITGNHGSDLYTISLQETTSSTPIYFMAKASPTSSNWYSTMDSCEMSKQKDASYVKSCSNVPKEGDLLHMGLCGPMGLQSINGKKYILDMCVRTDRGTEFLNKTLHAYFKEEGIEHQTSTPRTPKQNDVVERQNRTLVEAARTMLSASKLPLSFWAEAVATACYTQNRSIIISTHGKTAYHIINDRKPSIKHLHIFGCICYITRDGENLDKMKEKGDPCVMVGYSTQSKGYRVYNKRTRLIVESIHIKFDEIKEMMSDHNSSDLAPQ
ncbi:retrovirus-related pol polyprotein from transposon TNT 1-94 [Tanacetum coccineum]